MKIMLADDEESIKIVVEHIVIEEGYEFLYASDGNEALQLFHETKPDLVILDVMMPRINGFDVCTEIRKLGYNTPIIILSAKGDIVDKSVGFQSGADDYLVKPFSSEELSLRIQALLRRSSQTQEFVNDYDVEKSIMIGDIEIIPQRYELKVNGKLIDLTPKEFKIVLYMATQPGEIFTKKQLLTYVWGEDYIGEISNIAVFIRRIREKIEVAPSKPKYLQTVWGIGYKFGEKE